MFTIEFQPNELDLLGKILQEHPYKMVAGLIHSINEQVQTQLKNEQTRSDA